MGHNWTPGKQLKTQLWDVIPAQGFASLSIQFWDVYSPAHIPALSGRAKCLHFLCYSFEILQSLLPHPYFMTWQWKEKQQTDEFTLCHLALSSNQHVPCTTAQLTGTLCHFFLSHSELCCTRTVLDLRSNSDTYTIWFERLNSLKAKTVQSRCPSSVKDIV